MPRYKLIERLGEGAEAVVDLVRDDDGNEFALRRERLDKDGTKNNNLELKFQEDVVKKHPGRFMPLLRYKELKASDCDKGDGNLCVAKLYPVIRGTANQVEFNDPCTFYSFCAQVVYCLVLMERAGYTHGDFHPGNIGTRSVPYQSTVRILNKDVPTYGTLFIPIDYGSLVDKTDRARFTDRHHLDMITPVMKKAVNLDEYWEFVSRNNVKLDFNKDMRRVLRTKEAESLRGVVRDDKQRFELMTIVHPEIVQKTILGKVFTHTIYPKLLLPRQDYIDYFGAAHDVKGLLKFVLSKVC